MGIDMFEHRFREEIEKLPPFTLSPAHDRRVWDAKLPAWRPLFSALLHLGHSTGYRLASFDQFYRYVETSWTRSYVGPDQYDQWFTGEFREPMKRRIGIWYLSGMAEQQVYLALAEALEDRGAKNGLVFYDTRHDIKHKYDAFIVCCGRTFAINIYWGEPKSRRLTEQLRHRVELDRKANTGESSHWFNRQAAESMKIAFYARAPSDLIEVNGIPLFSRSALNGLLTQIYDECEIVDGYLFPLARNQRVADVPAW